MAKKSKVKGKSPKGRAGQKQRAHRDASYSAGAHRGLAGRQRFVPDDDDDDDDFGSLNTFKGFSGSTQQRPRHDAFRDASIRLRNQAISFVSAGANASTLPQRQEADVDVDGESQKQEDEISLDDEEMDDDAIQTNIVMEPDIGPSEVAMANMRIDAPAAAVSPPSASASVGLDGVADEPDDASFFVVDTEGDASLRPFGGKLAVRRNASPARSDSSEEVVVFHGRNKPVVVNDPIHLTPGAATPATSESRQSPRPLNPAPVVQSAPTQPDAPAPDLLTALEATLEADQPSSANEWSTAESSQPAAKGWAAGPSKQQREVNLDATWAPAPAGSWWKKKNQLQADWKQTLRDKKSDVVKLSSSSKPKRRGTRGARKADNRHLRNNGGGGDDTDDESGISEAAYVDYMENLKAGLDAEDGGDSLPAFVAVGSAHNAVLAGPSMVVDGREVADDEVINMHSGPSDDDSDDDDGLIGQDLSELSFDDDDDDLSGLDDTELEDALEYSEQQQWEDDADLRRRRAEAKTDEQIARLFAKQHELGISDDDLVIDDGSYGDDPDLSGVGDVAAARAGLANITNFDLTSMSTKSRKRSARSKGGPTFADATMLADVVEQYGQNGFDIMDFDRPSLRPTKKGRKGRLPPELEALSDDELKQSMLQAWDNDRLKKAQKRAERDALRIQGLLGSSASRSKADQPSLRDKYPRGITMAQVHVELRAFMLDDDALDRPFPPMSKQDRKELHQIAIALKLKSKSVGAGSARHPVLTKTRATRYAPATLDAALTASSAGWLGSRTGLKKVARAGRAGASGAGSSKAAVGLRHGEVVGAGAAEIGKENFGHRMMEKMGWSRGQALGKDGEGRLVPVEQVMRAGRAGLG